LGIFRTLSTAIFSIYYITGGTSPDAQRAPWVHVLLLLASALILPTLILSSLGPEKDATGSGNKTYGYPDGGGQGYLNFGKGFDDPT